MGLYMYICVLSLYASVGGNPRMPREVISGKVVLNRTGPGPVRAKYSPPLRHRVVPGPRFLGAGGFVRAPRDVQESSVTGGIFALLHVSMTHHNASTGDSGCR